MSILMDNSSCEEERRRRQVRLKVQNYRYEQLSREQLIQVLKEKNRVIEDLDLRNKRGEEFDMERLEMFRQKLSDEMAQNEKAVASFAKIVDRLLLIMNKFVGGSDLLDSKDQLSISSQSSIGRIEHLPRRSVAQRRDFAEEQMSGVFSESSSCLEDEIIEEVFAVLSRLDKITDSVVSNSQGLLERLRASESQCDMKVLEQEKLKQMLARNEMERHHFMRDLSNAVGADASLLKSMERPEMISYIEKLSYRLREVEGDKRRLLEQVKEMQESNYHQYRRLLHQVKVIKKGGSI